MARSLQALLSRWKAWVGDRDLEMAIRKQISQEGYFGRSAKFHNVRMVAVERPGWVQVYRFEVTARPDTEGHAESQWLLGIARDDGRSGTIVRVFTNPEERKSLFAEWTAGLICLRGSEGLR